MDEAHLECVKLDVGVAVCQALDDTRDGLFGPVGIGRHFVAHLNDGAPILGCEVLVCRLGYREADPSACYASVGRGLKHLCACAEHLLGALLAIKAREQSGTYR